MKIDGSCHCGRISYEAELDPEKVGICHCADCQTLSGTAFRTIALVSADSFKISGEPKIYVKTGESGNRRAQSFCPECGSPIYASAAEDDPKVYNLRLVTVRQRDRLLPNFQIWRHSAQGWRNELESVPGKRKTVSEVGGRFAAAVLVGFKQKKPPCIARGGLVFSFNC